LYATVGGLFLGPWGWAALQIIFAGGSLLEAELHFLQLLDEKAGPIIRELSKNGPTALCLGTKPPSI
jgi:hypothetical protein